MSKEKYTEEQVVDIMSIVLEAISDVLKDLGVDKDVDE